jgi:hypothetical protein
MPFTTKYKRRVTVSAQIAGCTSPYTNIAVGMSGVVESARALNKAYQGANESVVFYNVYYSSAYHTITVPITKGRGEVLACKGVKLTVTKA